MRTRLRAALAAAALLAAGCKASAPADAPAPLAGAEPLHQAVQQLTDVMVYDIFSPPQASRTYAYASIAAYEVLRQGDTVHRTMAGQVNGLTPVPAPPPASAGELSLPLAGVHAFMTVSQALTFSRERMDSLRRAMDQRFRNAGMAEDVYARSIAYGDTVARHVLAWASKDRFKESRGMPKYSVTNAPGTWIPTPPAYMDAVEPNWGRLRPFVLDSGDAILPVPPPAYDTARTSPYWREVREVYDVSRALTAEQREILAFWDCNPYVMHVQGHTMFATKKITPGGHWMGIVGLASRRANADIATSAEAYARTAMALADGFIGAWAEKYRSRMVRPETVINASIDEAWQPALQTPPFPEYPSGHSVISTAAAEVLTDQFGDGFAFADSSEMPYGLPVREFGSFRQAANEAAISRLYGGIHFRAAIEQGQVQGRRIGEAVVARVRTRGTAPAPVVASRH